MHVEYSGKNLSLTDALKAKAEKKIAKLERFTGNIISAHASFEVERHQHRVDLVIHCARERIYKATGVAEDMYMAINEAVDAVEQQAKKEKTKRLAGRSKGPAPGAPAEEGEEDEEEAPKTKRRGPLVARRDDLFHPKPLRVADALLILQESGAPVLVFENLDTGGVAVLFRDGRSGVGLVSPPSRP
jgi:putative sigma-54 modulation protein